MHVRQDLSRVDPFLLSGVGLLPPVARRMRGERRHVAPYRESTRRATIYGMLAAHGRGNYAGGRRLQRATLSPTLQRRNRSRATSASARDTVAARPEQSLPIQPAVIASARALTASHAFADTGSAEWIARFANHRCEHHPRRTRVAGPRDRAAVRPVCGVGGAHVSRPKAEEITALAVWAGIARVARRICGRRRRSRGGHVGADAGRAEDTWAPTQVARKPTSRVRTVPCARRDCGASRSRRR